MKKLVIIIPAYNESASITDVINAIPQKIEGVDAIKVLVVDDGSTDGTAQAVKSKTQAIVFSHGQNLGLGQAFHTGIDWALDQRADIVVTIDADGQFEARDIPTLVTPIVRGQADFVTASRFIDKNLLPEIPKFKLWGNRKVAWLVSLLTGRKFYDVSCGFRAYGSEALLRLNLFGKFTYTQEVFLDLSFKGLRIVEVPIRVKYFQGRVSRVAGSLFRYAWRILLIMFSSMRDYRPLLFFGAIGGVIFGFGLLLDLGLLVYFWQTGAFSPFKSVGVTGITLNIFGLIVAGLGFVADMLARIRFNQEKVLYYVKKSRWENKS